MWFFDSPGTPEGASIMENYFFWVQTATVSRGVVQAVRLQWQSSHKFVSRYDISDFFALNLKRYAIVFGYIGAFLKLSPFEFLAIKSLYNRIYSFLKIISFYFFQKPFYWNQRDWNQKYAQGKNFIKKVFLSYHCTAACWLEFKRPK